MLLLFWGEQDIYIERESVCVCEERDERKEKTIEREREQRRRRRSRRTKTTDLLILCCSFDSITYFFEGLIVSFLFGPLFFSPAPSFWSSKGKFLPFSPGKGHLGTQYCVLSVAVDVVPLIICSSLFDMSLVILLISLLLWVSSSFLVLFFLLFYYCFLVSLHYLSCLLFFLLQFLVHYSSFASFSLHASSSCAAFLELALEHNSP